MKNTVERLKTYVANGALGKQNPIIFEKPFHNYQNDIFDSLWHKTILR